MAIRTHPTQQSFVGDLQVANNPTWELLREANNAFRKDRRVAQILSIGSGLSRVVSLSHAATEEDVGEALADLASNDGEVARDLAIKLSDVDAYLRLNVN